MPVPTGPPYTSSPFPVLDDFVRVKAVGIPMHGICRFVALASKQAEDCSRTFVVLVGQALHSVILLGFEVLPVGIRDR